MYMYMRTMHVSTMQKEIYFIYVPNTGCPDALHKKPGHPVFRSSRGRISYPASSDAVVFIFSLCCWSAQWGVWSAMESSSQLQVYVYLKI